MQESAGSNYYVRSASVELLFGGYIRWPYHFDKDPLRTSTYAQFAMSHAGAELGTGLRRWQWWHRAVLGAIILLALAPCDLPIARLCYRDVPPNAVVRILEIVADVAGGGFGVILVLTGVVAFSRTKWSRVPLLVSVVLSGGLLADLGKLCVSRVRPHSVDLSVETFASTFRGVLRFFSTHSGEQSFPSGHAATAVGLAIALTMIYPRGRWFFVLIAVTVSISRVMVHAHFPTDVVAGAMLGATSAFSCYRGFAAPAFARCERAIDRIIAQRKDKRQAILVSQHESLDNSDSAQVVSKDKSNKHHAA